MGWPRLLEAVGLLHRFCHGEVDLHAQVERRIQDRIHDVGADMQRQVEGLRHHQSMLEHELIVVAPVLPAGNCRPVELIEEHGESLVIALSQSLIRPADGAVGSDAVAVEVEGLLEAGALVVLLAFQIPNEDADALVTAGKFQGVITETTPSGSRTV